VAKDNSSAPFSDYLAAMASGFQDKKNLLATLTAKKIVNAAKIYHSYHVSRLTGKAGIKGLPISLAIEPTTSCNLRCPECPSGLRSFTRPTGMLDRDLFRGVVDELAPTLSYLTFYFQGEPFLHPQFTDMVQYASTKGIYTSTSTNAHYLKDETAEATIRSGLNRIIISIDGTTQETYESYRVGGSLQKVLEGTRNLIKWKRKLSQSAPQIVFQFLVVKHNEHQLKELYKIAGELGVDNVVLKTAQIEDYKNGSPLMPSDAYSRYKRGDDGTFTIKNALLNHCWKMWNSAVVTWDGKIVPCCFDKDATHVLGDVNNKSFNDIWNGEAYNRFRNTILKSRSSVDICTNCTEGTKVWA
jgi:radical SAM protein with 4Fe4S-binding SPASM domain